MLQATCEAAAPPEKVSRAALSAESLPKWFRAVKRVEAEPGWPALGTRMTWWVGPGGRWRFAARVIENLLPDSVTLEVETPSASSTITQRFIDIGGERTRYEKTVEPRYRSKSRLYAALMNWIIGSSMKKEVASVAAVAEGRL